MSTEDEIEAVERLIGNVEEYIEEEVWHPAKQEQMARETVEADKVLHQLMDGHTFKIDLLSEVQIKRISDLLKRLRDIKDKPLLSPPWSNLQP